MLKNDIQKKILRSLTLLPIMYVGTCSYFFQYSFGRKNRSANYKEKEDIEWLKSQKKEYWYLKSDNLELVALYLPSSSVSDKTVIVAHGWHENFCLMSPYIKMFHELGYNVLAPDDRGSGLSSGKYLAMGWLDRLDYIKWIKKIIENHGNNVSIALFGVSMGGSTVMNVSGELLPQQVKCIIEDCGFSSIYEEFFFVLKNRYHLYPKLILSFSSKIVNYFCGFSLQKADTLKQLRKNKLPILFIHGDSDNFVPTYMAYKNYDANNSYKEIWISRGVDHANTYYLKPLEYKRKIKAFLNKYL